MALKGGRGRGVCIAFRSGSEMVKETRHESEDVSGDLPVTSHEESLRSMVDLAQSKWLPGLLEGWSSRDGKGGRQENVLSAGLRNIVGRSPAMVDLYRQVEMVAGTDVTILLEGETGTGKNLIARTIHELSTRAGKRLVSLSASNLHEQLFESELFGYVKGAFSGADHDHEGLARAAAGGTLFIDEVGELSAVNQARLLRFLDTKEVRPVGSTRSIAVDVRILAATNRRLREAVESGDFREDLYYRLRVVRLRVPPLCERPEDLPLLIDHFLERFAREHHKEIEGLSDAAREALLAHSWSGNVRELENEIERAVVMTPEGGAIELSALSSEIRPEVIPRVRRGTGLREYRREAESRLIVATLERYGWNVSAAARELGFSRVGLTKKIKRLGIDRPE